jgi:hypothetical protein
MRKGSSNLSGSQSALTCLCVCARARLGLREFNINEATPSPTLPDKDVNKLQQLTGTILYYARAVDPTLIMPVNVLASKQSNATEVTADKVIKLINYCNTHPEKKYVTMHLT